MGSQRCSDGANDARLRLVTADDVEANSGDGDLSPEMRLSELFEAAYLPLKLAGRKAKTIQMMRDSLAKWACLRDDPPLRLIDDFDCASFPQELAKLPGRKHPTLSPSTVFRHCDNIQRLLDFAASRLRISGQIVQLIELAPRIPCEKPDAQPPDERVPDLAELERMLVACAVMRTPKSALTDIAPADWWRTLWTVAFYEGWRIGALTQIEYAMITGDVAMLPGRIMKGRTDRQTTIHPLHGESVAAIEAIRTPRKHIWPWPHCRRYLDTCRWKLLEAAGFSVEEIKWRLGFHATRRLHVTLAERIQHGAGTLSAGHRSAETTRRSYTHSSVDRERLAQVKAQLPRLPGRAGPRQMKLF